MSEASYTTHEIVARHGVVGSDLVMQIRVDPGRLTAYVAFDRPESSGGATSTTGSTGRPCARRAPVESVDDVIDRLREHGIKVYPEEVFQRSKILERALDKGEVCGPVRVAKGSPARDGRDAYLQWSDQLQKIFSNQGPPSSHGLPSRQIHKNRTIATVVPARPGDPGIDVFGEQLPAKAGHSLEVVAGQNVAVSDDGERTYVATENGLVRWDGKNLSVESQLTIPGNLDYSIGDVEFCGSLRVEGDVLDGFDVNVGKDLEITGTVSAATVRAGGDLAVRGGVAGKKEAILEAHGKIDAKYLSGCKIDARGSVRVHRGIMHSEVGTSRSVRAPTGKLLGGRVVAGKTIDIGMVGSSMEIATAVIVGIDHEVYYRLRRLNRTLESIQRQMDRVERQLEELWGSESVGSQMTADRHDEYGELVRYLEDLDAEYDRRSNQFEATAGNLEVDHSQVIRIRETLSPGVRVRIGQYECRIHREWTGPIVLRADPSSETIEFIRPGS